MEAVLAEVREGIGIAAKPYFSMRHGDDFESLSLPPT